MNSFSVMLAAAGALAATIGLVVPASASQDNPQRTQKADLSGLHDFDFLVGEWRVQHRRLKERLANSHEWVEFAGTCSNRGLMDGWGNVDENRIDLPGDEYRGVGTFHADDTLRGKPIRIRFVWSKITPTSAHWEQAFSPDGGQTWEVNWTMEFQRVS